MEKKGTGSVTDLTKGVIWQQLVLFALPFLFSNLLQQFYSTADAAIVGQSVGAGALAAIGSCDRLVFLLINLFVGVSTGASIAVSQAFGRKDESALFCTVHSAVTLGLLSGAFLTLVGILLAPKLLVVMNTPEDVLPMAEDYIRIYFMGMIPVMVYNMGSGILRALGNSRSALVYLAVSGVINVGLDLLFVRIFSWGVKGAAAATAISQVLPAILVFGKLTRLDEAYRLRVCKLRLYWKETVYIVQVGVPAGLRMVLINVSNVIVQSRVNAFGMEAMAGCTLFFKIEGYLYALISALSLALTSFAGQNIGAADYIRAKKGKQICMRIAFGVTFAMTLLLCIWARPICQVFTGEEGAITYGVLQLRYQLPLYIIFSWNEIINGAVLSSGHSMAPMLISLFGMCVARVGFIFVVSAYVYDIRVIYLAFPFSWLVTHAGIQMYYYLGRWIQGKRFLEAVREQAAERR
ncbi:MAG: MATE family efflux transporter [Lachnospiraceae bacterium]|nr:MATE family efflux transporter [Lachnospiraceae bacterium]